MGRIDSKTSDYFDNRQRFADLWNGIIYNGSEVIKPDELITLNTVINSSVGNAKKKIITDHTMKWNGRYLRVLAQENQSYVDYRMVLRNMLTEAMLYDKQWKDNKERHEEIKDLIDKDEFLSKMKKDDKFIPVITMVINLSENRWDGATELYDLLDIGDDEVTKELISNYKLNLFDYHDYENFEIFKTELREVFSYLRYQSDEVGMHEIIDKYKKGYSEMDEETASLLEELTNTKGIRKGGKVNMCKAWDDHYKSGVKFGEERGMKLGEERGMKLGEERGIEEGIKNLVKTCKDLTNLVADAVEQLIKRYGLERSVAEEKVKLYW